jgi:hypothetical protein
MYYNGINPYVLNDDELRVVQVCKLLETGMSHKDICINVYGVFDNNTRGAVAHIDHRRQWKYISEYYNVNQKSNAKGLITDEQAHMICKSIQNGCTNSQCADSIGIDLNHNDRGKIMKLIAKVRRRENYKDIASQYNW